MDRSDDAVSFVKSTNKERHVVIDQLVQIGEIRSAIGLLTAAVDSGVGSPEMQIRLADIYRLEGDVEAARSILIKAKETKPRNPWPSVHLARLELDRRGAASDNSDLAPVWAILDEALSRLTEGRHAATVFNEYCKTVISRHFVPYTSISLSALTHQHEPVLSAVVVTMAKDEEDIIFSFLHHNYNIGFRKFVIMDNGSTDRTINEINRFRLLRDDAMIVLVDDRIIGYYQDCKTTALAHFARHYFPNASGRIDWIFPLDADEFITFSDQSEVRNVKELIGLAEEKGHILIQYCLINCASSKLIIKADVGSDPFSLYTVREKLSARYSPKVAFKYCANANIHMGNHFVENVISKLADIFVGSTRGVVLSHFPLRSVSHARTKYVNGGIAYRNAPDRAKHGRAWQLNYERYLELGDAFFMEMFKNYVDRVKANSEGSP